MRVQPLFQWFIIPMLLGGSQGLVDASVPIAAKDLPQPVSRAVREYFPGAKILTAERDTDDRRTEFEVKLRYKEIHLKVELSPDGRILDVDVVR